MVPTLDRPYGELFRMPDPTPLYSIIMEVISAGTRNAAAACGQIDDLGTLESGKLADVIVVNGNPLEDYELLANVVAVIKNGEIVFSENTK